MNMQTLLPILDALLCACGFATVLVLVLAVLLPEDD
jgi:hypothetical protein